MELSHTFLRQGQNCFRIHLYGANIEKAFYQNMLKTKGWYLQYMSKVVTSFSPNQNFIPRILYIMAPSVEVKVGSPLIEMAAKLIYCINRKIFS